MGLALSLESLGTPKVSKKVNTGVASMELVEAMMHLNDATDGLNTALRQCDNVVATITNMQAIRASVEQFGITDALFSLVDRESLAASLNVVIPDKLDKSSAKAIKASVEANIGASLKNAAKALGDFITKLWTKFTNFVAWFFKTNNGVATMIKNTMAVKDLNSIGDVGDKFVAPDYNELKNVMNDITTLSTPGADEGETGRESAPKIKFPESMEGTPASLNWNGNNLQEFCNKTVGFLEKKANLIAQSKEADKSMKDAKAKAKAAEGGNADALKEAKDKFEKAKNEAAAVSEIIKALNKLGRVAVSMLRKCKDKQAAK